MAAGEAGADYVLFGEPDAKGQRPSVEAIAERLQWWAELFEPPCVGFAASREEATNSPPPAPISSWSAISSGPIRAAPAAALTEVEQAIRQAHAATFGKAKAEQG